MPKHPKLLAVAASALALAGGGAAAVAQSAPPTVTVDLAAASAAVRGADALGTGPTTLELGSRRGERFALVVRLKPDVTPAAFRRGLARLRGPAEVRRYGTSVASGGARPGQAYRTTVTLTPATYAVVDLGRRGARLVGSFTAGETPSGAAAPAPAATVAMTDFGFAGPRTLPADGVVRFENRGRQFHEAVLFRARSGAGAAALARKLARGEEPGRRDVAGPPVPAVGLVDAGTVNDVSARMAPGAYVMVCFLPDERSRRGAPHAKLGMVERFTVR